MLCYHTKHAVQQRDQDWICWFFLQEYWMLSKRDSQPWKAKAWAHVYSRGFTPPGSDSTNTSCSTSLSLYHVSIFGQSASRVLPVGSYPCLLARAKHSSCIMKWTYFAKRSSTIAHLYLGVWTPIQSCRFEIFVRVSFLPFLFLLCKIIFLSFSSIDFCSVFLSVFWIVYRAATHIHA